MAAEASTQAARRSQSQTRRRSAPRSSVWVHFTRFTDDNGNDKARCKRCSLVLGASTRNGTSTLRAHVRICWGDQAVPASNSRAPQQLPVPPLPPPCAPSSSAGGLQDQNGSEDLARMIALHGYDPSFLEDDYFRSFVRRLNPEFELPSRVAIEEMCDGICDEARRDLLDRLSRAPGKVNVAVGKAKTMDEQVVYVACHFIDDGWNLHKLLLHAVVAKDRHDDEDGPILGLDVRNFRWDVLVRLRQVVSDHGIADDRLFMVAYETIDKDIPPALKDNPFCHLGPICTNPKWKEIFFTTYVDKVLHSVARCLLPGTNFISAVVFHNVADFLLTRQGRLELLAELGLHYGWAYDEHWYAFYCSLEVLCKKDFLRQLDAELATEIKLLCQLWEKIDRAIQKFSFSTGPTANLYLAELFKLREILQLELARFSSGDHEDVYDLVDIKKASDTLDKAIEDSYLSWSLPLALDPRYKLKFITFNFERAYGSEAAKEYISKVMTMITELYADYATEYGTTTDGADHSDSANAMDITTGGDNPLQKAWNEHRRSEQGMTTQVTRSSYPEAETELDRYLRDPLAPDHPQTEGFDILSWWKAHSSEYPMVARMARDALAMPTCSKLSTDHIAQVRSILRGYSKKPYLAKPE